MVKIKFSVFTKNQDVTISLGISHFINLGVQVAFEIRLFLLYIGFSIVSSSNTMPYVSRQIVLIQIQAIRWSVSALFSSGQRIMLITSNQDFLERQFLESLLEISTLPQLKG